MRIALFALTLAACDPVAAAPSPAPAPTPTPTPTPTPAPAPALSAVTPFASLPVPGFSDAVVSLPLHAISPKPVIVAMHGNYDRPEWQCEVWRSIVGSRAFVLCPRGVARPDSPSAADTRFTFDHRWNAELDAALGALHDRYGAFVDPGPIVYTGFSLGAILGVHRVLRDPSATPRVVLVEGGHAGWNVRAFAAKGGARVLFACGQPGCVTESKPLAASLEKAGVGARVVYGEREGHSYAGKVADRIREQIDWLFEGDSRFSSASGDYAN